MTKENALEIQKINIKVLIVKIICFTIIIESIFMVLALKHKQCTPYNTLDYQQNLSQQLQQVEHYIDTQQYKLAMDLYLKLNLDNNSNYSFNINKYHRLITEFKKVLISDVEYYTSINDNEKALNILNNYQKYYICDNEITELKETIENHINTKNLVEYTGEIEHLFTHCLLAFPELALNPKNNMSKDFDRDCLTPSEFKKILLSLYNNDYILIDINSAFENKNGVTYKKKLYLPKGKKPLIFSFDDCNYDSKKRNKGMVDKIILDRNNQLATYTSKQTIADRVSYDNEFIPILEQFVKTHPDFSHKGAKGLICLTGYDGILGYRTQKTNATSRYEIKKAKEVVNALKKSGWTFACHSYGHYHMKKLNDMEFAKEINYWVNEVEPIIGKTNIYVYPYGEWEVVDDNGEITYKHQLLLDSGFQLFCGVGADGYYGYIPIGTKAKHTLLMDRKPIDGRTLRNFKERYQHLFDCEQVYDNVNRTIPYHQ